MRRGCSARRERKAAIEAELERLHDEHHSHEAAVSRAEDARLAKLVLGFRRQLIRKRMVKVLRAGGNTMPEVCAGRMYCGR